MSLGLLQVVPVAPCASGVSQLLYEKKEKKEYNCVCHVLLSMHIVNTTFFSVISSR
jgi:hypothetical protein